MRLRGTALGYAGVATIAAGEGGFGVLLAPYLSERGLPIPAIGAVIALNALAGLVSRWPAGRWYRPGLVRALLVLGLLFEAVGAIGFALAPGIAALTVLRALCGVGFGLCTTVAFAVFIDALPADQPRDRSLGLFTVALSGGYTIGNLLGGALGDRFGYTTGFAGIAVLALVAALAVALAVEPQVVRVARPGGTGWRGVLHAVRDPALQLILLQVFVLDFLFGAYNGLLPLYLVALGATLGDQGLMRALFSATGFGSRLGASTFALRLGPRQVAPVALVVQLVALGLMAATGDLLVLGALLMLIGGGRGFALVSNTLLVAENSERSVVGRGASSAIYNAASDLGVLIGPLAATGLGGWIGIQAAFVALACGLLTILAVGLWVVGRQPRPQPAPID